MSTSKTARAAMKAGASTTKAAVVDDATLVKQYREDRAAGLWPALPKSDAVLRVADAESLRLTAEIERLDATMAANDKEIAELKRQLVLAESKNETYKKALADVEQST